MVKKDKGLKKFERGRLRRNARHTPGSDISKTLKDKYGYYGIQIGFKE